MSFLHNLFIFFLLQVLISGLISIFFQRNPIYALLFLILTFFNYSVFLITVGVEFIALLFLIIYVGAISILFMFVLMMLNIKYLELNNFQDYNIIGFFAIITLFFIEFIFFSQFNFLFFNFRILEFSYTDWIEIYFSKGDLEHIGFVLYNFNFFDFCISGIILLSVMINCITLVASQNIISKVQILFQQLSAKTKLLLKN